MLLGCWQITIASVCQFNGESGGKGTSGFNIQTNLCKYLKRYVGYSLLANPENLQYDRNLVWLLFADLIHPACVSFLQRMFRLDILRLILFRLGPLQHLLGRLSNREL